MTEHYDIIIVGTGAGGGTMAHALSQTDARVLIIERGDFVPQEDENWNPEAVWKHLRYQTKERWLDDQDPRAGRRERVREGAAAGAAADDDDVEAFGHRLA